MSTKTRAEVWADMVEAMAPGAAKELRRLSASEAALLEALESLEPHLDAIVCYASTMGEYAPNRIASKARALIARTKEARNV